jgi:hypothetical protein
MNIELNKTTNQIFSVACCTCNNETRQLVLSSVEADGDQWNGDDCIHWFFNYQIIQCQGCESISFRRVSNNSDNYYQVSEDEFEYDYEEEIFPALIKPLLTVAPTRKPTDTRRRFKLDHPRPEKAAFVIMKFQNTSAHERITKVLNETLSPYGIIALRADMKSYDDNLWTNTVTYMRGCGFGIAVLERLSDEDFNPNVSLEIGYMLALGKQVCLLKDQTIKQLPTDLVGRLYQNFDAQNPETTIPPVLNKWLSDKGFIK